MQWITTGLYCLLSISFTYASHVDPESPEGNRPEKKYADAYCVLHSAVNKSDVQCSLAGSDRYREPGDKWLQNPSGVLASKTVISMGACKAWCEQEFPKQQSAVESERLRFAPSGLSAKDRLSLQMKDCERQKIALPPTPFGKGWTQNGKSFAEGDLWVKNGPGALWEWDSADKKTKCYGFQREGKETVNTGLLCYAIDSAGNCPTCFFDIPKESPSSDGKKIGSALHEYGHHQKFDERPAEVCTSCHTNKSSPLLFSPKLEAQITNRPDCKSFTAVGMEMYELSRTKKGVEALKSCTGCHPGWDKEFHYSDGYLRTVMARAIESGYMPRGDKAKHEAALKYLKEAIRETYIK